MIAFHNEFRVSPTIADKITLRNKIPTDGALWHPAAGKSRDKRKVKPRHLPTRKADFDF
jgi:hypothetical protein